MRRLGIPNTKHFHDITTIADATALYAKLKSEVDAEVWKPDAQEEFEDSEGNVLSRKVRCSPSSSPSLSSLRSSALLQPGCLWLLAVRLCAQTYEDLARQGLL
jgi:hypothetical protein